MLCSCSTADQASALGTADGMREGIARLLLSLARLRDVGSARESDVQRRLHRVLSSRQSIKSMRQLSRFAVGANRYAAQRCVRNVRSVASLSSAACKRVMQVLERSWRLLWTCLTLHPTSQSGEAVEDARNAATIRVSIHTRPHSRVKLHLHNVMLRKKNSISFREPASDSESFTSRRIDSRKDFI